MNDRISDAVVSTTIAFASDKYRRWKWTSRPLPYNSRCSSSYTHCSVPRVSLTILAYAQWRRVARNCHLGV